MSNTPGEGSISALQPSRVCVFDVLLMQQSVSHKSARDLILIINNLMLSADNNLYKASYGGS